MRAQVNFLPDSRRLHLQDGPIDLILQAFGPVTTVKVAYAAAIERFSTILDELCQELPLLRSPSGPTSPHPTRATARRMAAAVAPYAPGTFITPMAAVAGAVAEEILQAMVTAAPLSKAYVNDGGDIALHLEPGQQFVVGMIDRPERPSLFGTASIRAADPVRGIATSGCRGRSFSLGIADAVTVLAKCAAGADAAATVIANAVDIPDHPNIHRTQARTLAPDSDLGNLLVTCEVGELSREDVHRALANGSALAHRLLAESLIYSAALHLRGITLVISGSGMISSTAPPVARSLIYA